MLNGAVMDRVQALRAQAMARVEQARSRARARIGGGTSGTILDNVRAAVNSGGILAQVRQRVQRQPILGQLGKGALVGSSSGAVSAMRDEVTPGTGIAVKKILV